MSKAVRIMLAQVALALLVLGWALHPAWAVAAVVPFGLQVRPPRRRRSLPSSAGLLAAVRPGAVMRPLDIDGVDVGVVEDADGLAAMIRVGDLTDLLGDAPPPMPPLNALLPPAEPDLPEARVQLLVGATAPFAGAGPTPAATSYRQLTDGRVLAHRQVLLSVRIRRAGGYQREDLERSLVAAVRRACRLLGKAGLPARPLSGPSALAALAEAAGHRGDLPVREVRRGLEVGGARQAVFRLRRWPRDGPLAERLLTLPCSAVTVALVATAGEETCRAELTIRLAAATPTALDHATAALRQLATALGGEVARLDGAQLDALAATLPLGGGAPTSAAMLAGLLTGRDDLTLDGTAATHVTAAHLAALAPAVGGDGLMLGVNRHGAPVLIRPFRAEPTRAVLIGGLRCAEMLTLRALALGARVTVQSIRPDAWSPFLRGLGGEPISVVPAGQPVDLPPPTASDPQLLVVDAGPAEGGQSPVLSESAWRATLIVRDELTATDADADLLTRADLVLLQPLSPAEAAIATEVLGLGESASWLTRIPPEMLGIVVSRHTVRWAHLSPTAVEVQLTGGPDR